MQAGKAERWRKASSTNWTTTTSPTRRTTADGTSCSRERSRSPSPRPLHQRVSKRLQRQLEAYFEEKGLGEVFNAPVDVILTMHDVVVPDLVVVTTPPQVTERAIEGPTAIIVEILSPSTQSRDRQLKAGRYAALGVVHYWIVDPVGRTLECYRLEEGRYVTVLTPRDRRASSIRNGRT